MSDHTPRTDTMQTIQPHPGGGFYVPIESVKELEIELRAVIAKERDDGMMRLAAISTASISNTRDTFAELEKVHADYDSMAFQDVKQAIKREMILLRRVQELKAFRREVVNLLERLVEVRDIPFTSVVSGANTNRMLQEHIHSMKDNARLALKMFGEIIT